MSDPLVPWTPLQQWQHRQTLLSALQGDDEHDPEWPALAAVLVPEDDGYRDGTMWGTVRGTWYVLAWQREGLLRQARDEGVSEGAVLRRVLTDHLAVRRTG